MQDLIVFGGITLLVLFGVPLINLFKNALVSQLTGITPSDDDAQRVATAALYDPEEDFSVQGKPKMGGVVDEDGYF